MTDQLFGNSRWINCKRCGRGHLERHGCMHCRNRRPFPAEWAASHREPVAAAVAHELRPAWSKAIAHVLVGAELVPLVGMTLVMKGIGRVLDAEDARRERWARDGSTVRQWFWLRVYECFDRPAGVLRKGALWAIGNAGDATDWGDK